ncbi:UDP-galactopyranose mutase [Algoriphagus kandeliae]|uniref:UDP-galactopyranose mutase n=1 Tax=Algoriphagus kandeliae TaxID=2562278 RepID=A0A4Y9QUC5_9BACT|nr:UDP-galactopyranose mutase [Algoriphagus kandeliae]TFV94565.1 UDP-galactopyranose mutase [Algoriphagus kandeliae]
MEQWKYDYLIVGAGLYGSVFACEATRRGKKCLVIDKRSHIGGNIYTTNIEGINVHKYGAHIFHTNNRMVWDYVNSFVKFNNFTNSPLANYKGNLYNLPFNMHTFEQLWGVKTEKEAKEKIEEQRFQFRHITNPKNLEEQALTSLGKDIYEKLIKGYSEKQWGRPAKEIPAFIIRRLPIRFTYNNNYFNDVFQGIPIGGYTRLIKRLLDGIEVKINCNYFEHKAELDQLALKIVYTGKIDEYFDYQFGKLEYRSLHFEHEVLEFENFQGNAVVNYTDKEVPFTRILEHKYFEFGTQKNTIITREFPHEFSKEKEPYYPINDDRNQRLLAKYQNLAKSLKSIHFGGRLAEYKYYDMHQIIEKAMNETF